MKTKLSVIILLLVATAVTVSATVRNEPEDNVVQWTESINEGEDFFLQIKSCDPNGQNFAGNYLRHTMAYMPEGMTRTEDYAICTEGDCDPPHDACDGNCIVYGVDLSWPNAKKGNYRVLVNVMDKAGNSDNKWFDLTVREVDVTPPNFFL